MRIDGNLRQAMQAMYSTLYAGYTITIQLLPDNTIEVVADPQGEEGKAKSQRRTLRTGRGTTLNDAMAQLAKKMGIQLPPADG